MIDQDEIKIIQAIALGCSDVYIAKIMCLSHSATKKRIAKIYEKLNATNRANAIHIAYQMGVLKCQTSTIK